MIVSPASAIASSLLPSPAFLPALQHSVPGAVLLPNTSTTAAALASANGSYSAMAASGLSANFIQPSASSYFEGVPIYLLSNSNITPFIMPKISDFPHGFDSLKNPQRVDIRGHSHIFVGDLSSEIDNKALRDAFSQFGEISETKVIRDLQTMKSKGYGFVSYVNRQDAERAIEEMNGQWLGRRAIRTNWATRKSGKLSSSSSSNVTRQRDRASDSDQSSDQANDDCGPPPARRRQIKNLTYEDIMSQTSKANSTVYVGGVPSAITDEELKQTFSKYGTIIQTRIFGQQGYAFVKFDQKESAAQAILHENNAEIDGSQIRCSWGKEGSSSVATVITQQQTGYNFGYNISGDTSSNLNRFWSQYYQYYANQASLQTYWQQAPLSAAAAAGLLLNLNQ